MKALITTSLLFFVVQVNAQLIDPEKEIAWRNIEVRLDNEKKADLVQDIETDLLWYLKDNKILESSLGNFHFLDFDNDGLLDFLYEGYAGAENKSVILFHQKSKRQFKKIFETLGVPYAFTRIGIFGSDFELQTLVPDGAFDGEGFIKKTYLLSPESSKLIESITFHYETFFPKGLTIKKRFKIVNSKYYLRISPEIKNEEKASDVLFGNVVAEYGEGSEGYAFASKEDHTGRIWWYVAIEGNKSTKSIYSNKEGYYLGWMSSRYLEEL